MSIQVKLTPSGRISIPADVRRRLGLRPGETVLLDETEEGLVIRSRTQALERAKALSRKIVGDREGFTVDDFLRERKRWQG